MLSNSQHEIGSPFERVRQLADRGINPYPHHFPRTCPLYEVNEDYEEVDELGMGVLLNLCGRVTAVQMTEQGLMLEIQDRDSKLLCAFQPQHLSDEMELQPEDEIIIGDFIGIEIDFLCRPQLSGKLTAYVRNWCFLALNIAPSPTTAQRNTYLHVGVDLSAREHLVLFSRIHRHIRRFLETHHGFLNFSTTVLSKGIITPDSQSPTQNRSFLQPSILLKQLIVGGLERVYEVYDNSLYHQPDYPQSQILECYASFASLNEMLALVEKLVSTMANYLHSTHSVWCDSMDLLGTVSPQNDEDKILIDLTPPWSHRSFYQLLEEATGVDFLKVRSIEEEIAVARKLGLDVGEAEQFSYVGQVSIEVLNQLVVPQLIQPTFIMGYPIASCPNAKPHRSNPQLAEVARLYINGLQFGMVMSDETNPYKAHHSIQNGAKMQPHTNTKHIIDPHFADALNYGVPPFSCLVIFVERLSLLMLGNMTMHEIIPSLT